MRENTKEYVIVGDANGYKGCLIYTIYGGLENAQKVLERMLNNPNENDILSMKGHENIRIETVEKDDAWWNW